MHSLFYLLSALVTLLLLVEGSPQQTQVQALYFQAPQEAPKEVYLVNAQSRQQVKITLPRKFFSPTYTLPKGGSLYYILPTPLKEQDQIPPETPQVKIPHKWGQVALLAAYHPKNSHLPIKLIPINASQAGFSGGDILFVNYTKALISGKIGTKELTLNPRKTVKVSKPAPDQESYRSLLYYRMNQSEPDRIFLSQAWRQSDRRRKLVFVYPEKQKIKLFSAILYSF